MKNKGQNQPHRPKRLLFAFLVIFSVGVLSGILFQKQLFSKQYSQYSQDDKAVREKRIGDYSHLTNPLLECEQFSVGDRNLDAVRYKLSAYIKEKIDSGDAKNISVYIRDLNNGPWVGIKEKESFAPASLLKIPVLIAYLKIAETNPGILDKVIPHEESLPGKHQNIKPKETIQMGQAYTVNELLHRMIKYSDNDATSLLLLNIDKNDLDRVYRDLQLIVPDVRNSEDFISIKDYASFFRILYNASYLGRAMSEKALKILTEVDFREGLVAGLPSGVKIAHKFGENTDPSGLVQLHECGIVYYDNSPYLIGVMTRGYDFGRLKNILQDISKIVYNHKESCNN